jgi:membrane protease YdiL (CAAX protease family)
MKHYPTYLQTLGLILIVALFGVMAALLVFPFTNANSMLATVSSASVFAIIHGNWAQGLGAFFIGLVIGWIYWKTNSIIPGIIIHFVNNAFAFSSIFFVDEKDALKNMSEYFVEPWVYVTA